MPVVSYVTTIYNKSRFITHVAEALFAQHGNFEKQFIFVDDGSTDDSLARLKQLTANRDDCILVTGENAGPSRATNKGLALASGDYIKLVDGDDILSADMTSEMISAMQASDCPVALGARGSYTLIDSNDPDFTGPPEEQSQVLKQPLKKIIKNAFFTPTHMLFMRNLLDRTGGCDDRVYIQDYSIALRLAGQASFVTVPNAIFYAPAEAENRMSHNVCQTLHDLNAALYYFFSETPDPDPALLAYAAKRATGRAWRWARRQSAPMPLRLKAFGNYLRCRIPHAASDNTELIRMSCEIFQATRTIRDPLL